MRRGPAVALLLAAALGLAGCVDSPVSAAQVPVGVLLPGDDGGSRWDDVDQPTLDNLVKGPDYAHQPTFETADTPEEATAAATELLDDGARVLVYAAANPQIDTAVTAVARARRIPTVGYDVTGAGISADFAVATDQAKVGDLPGRGLVRGVRAKQGAGVLELVAAPTEDALTALGVGYDNVLQPRYRGQVYRPLGRERVDPAGGPTVVDAYTPPPAQAAAASALVRALVADDRAALDRLAPPAPPGLPRTALVAPVAVYLSNINEVFTSGLVDSDDVCEGALALRCNQLSIP